MRLLIRSVFDNEIRAVSSRGFASLLLLADEQLLSVEDKRVVSTVPANRGSDMVYLRARNALTHMLYDIDRELLQVRNGYNIGRETDLGCVVVGTEEAMNKEFGYIIGGILRGPLGFELRLFLSEEVVKDGEPGGGSHSALQRLASI